MSQDCIKKVFLIVAFSCCWHLSFGQHTLIIESGQLSVGNATNLVLHNTQFINNGVFAAGTGTVSFTGDATFAQSAISGSSPTTFHNLKIDKSTNGCQLNQNIQVDNKLQMVAGILELNTHNVVLGQPNSIIEGESTSSYITGVGGGEVSITLDLNNPINANPGNMGTEITSAADLGTTTITRQHVPLSVDGVNSIFRSYTISPTNNTALAATLRLYYWTTS